MINADKSKLQISGDRTNIIFELNHIFEMLIQNQPEMFLGVMSAWSDIFSDTLDNLTKEQDFLSHVISNMSDDYIKMCKGKDINDEE